MKYGRLIGGYVAAVLVTLIVASFLHSHFTLQGLRAVGAVVSPADAWATAKADLTGLAPAFGAVIALALLLGFLIAGLVRRYVKWPRALAYGLGGGAAMLTALWLMHYNFQITPIGTARSWAGFLSLGLAGAIGGLVFTWITRNRTA